MRRRLTKKMPITSAYWPYAPDLMLTGEDIPEVIEPSLPT